MSNFGENYRKYLVDKLFELKFLDRPRTDMEHHQILHFEALLEEYDNSLDKEEEGA